MKINKRILDYVINNLPNEKYESGGLLGSDINGNIVRVVLDNGIDTGACRSYSYYPDIRLFNKCIVEWASSNICFAGIFHTHYSNTAVLSDADCCYINKIFSVVSDNIGVLYFPLILMPYKRFVPFFARMNNFGVVEIIKDDIEIIE